MTYDIMMPFYGDFSLFRKAVESVRGQTDEDWRLVVLDDAYPDLAPGEWLVSLRDPRIQYVRNERALGVSGNFNESVRLATSEFVTLMGCDDVMRPNYVRRVRTLVERFPNAAMVQPGVRVIDHEGALAAPLADRVKRMLIPRGPRPQQLRGETLAASLSHGNWCYFPSIAWRRDVLTQRAFRADLQMVQDLAMMIDIVLDGGTMVVDDEVVFDYRRHSASVSMRGRSNGDRFRQERAVLDEAAASFARLKWSRATRAARGRAMSRLHAALTLPETLIQGDRGTTLILAEHALGPLPRR